MPRFTRSTRDPNRDHLCEWNWKNVGVGGGELESVAVGAQVCRMTR